MRGTDVPAERGLAECKRLSDAGRAAKVKSMSSVETSLHQPLRMF